MKKRDWEDPLQKLARRVNILTVAFSIALFVLLGFLIDGRQRLTPNNSSLSAEHDSIRADIRRLSEKAK